MERWIMNEKLEKKLENAGLSFGECIGKAKRKFRNDKRVTSYSDEISKDEQKLFAEDEYLAGLVLEQIRIDKEITEHWIESF
jgi:3-methyladenine DNA glycosylase AlkD